jgi:hypothetical protein
LKYLFIFITILSLGIVNSRSQPGPPLDPLQGGEDIATAIILAGPLPVFSTGTTAGYLDNYDEACPYTGSGAPDVVYSFTPAAGAVVDIDLCGSSYDTKIFIYENMVDPGSPFDCNDDFYYSEPCGLYVSKIEGAVLTGGNTYYIVIDGYSSDDYGEYSLSITEAGPSCTWGVDVICPPLADPESEDCGDDANGGCNMAAGTETWEIVPSAGGTFCGTLWADGGDRDTDWFELVLAETSSVIVTADADQIVEYGLMEGGTGGYGGNPDCLTITGIGPGNTAGPCNETNLDLGLLAPGTYWFMVAMTVTGGFPCDNHYWVRFEVAPLTCVPPDELIALNIATTTADLSWTEIGASTSWEYQVGPAGFIPAATGTPTSSNPASISGLTANTGYDFYVRAECDPEFSEWAGPFNFTTLCDALSPISWSESFESAWPPECWTDTEVVQFGWDQSTFGSAHTGNEWAYCNLAGSKLNTPSFSLTSDVALSFWYRAEHDAFPQDLSVMVGDNTIYQISGITNTQYRETHVSLADYTGQTISITFNGGTGFGSVDFGICIDDVKLEPVNKWTGNISTAWDHMGNWSLGMVPGQDDLVFIPSLPAGGNFPVVAGGIAAECNFIEVAPGATVLLQGSGLLNVRNP